MLKVLVDGKPLPGSLVLGPRKTLDLLLQIEGLKDPGNYTGVLRVSSPTRKPADKAFELSLRRGIACAIVLILVGVILSTARARLLYVRSQRDAGAGRRHHGARRSCAFRTITPDLTATSSACYPTFLHRLDAVVAAMPIRAWARPMFRSAKSAARWGLFRGSTLAPARRGRDQIDRGRATAEASCEIMAILEKDGAPEADTDRR